LLKFDFVSTCYLDAFYGPSVPNYRYVALIHVPFCGSNLLLNSFLKAPACTLFLSSFPILDLSTVQYNVSVIIDGIVDGIVPTEVRTLLRTLFGGVRATSTYDRLAFNDV
jgi:hypothetical protein